MHGDLHPFNLLVDSSGGVDRLSAVIDFGDVTAGDPAVDLATAWLTLDRPGRRAFRVRVAAPEATWLRARGWVVALASALATADERAFRSVARRSIDAVLDD